MRDSAKVPLITVGRKQTVKLNKTVDKFISNYFING